MRSDVVDMVEFREDSREAMEASNREAEAPCSARHSDIVGPLGEEAAGTSGVEKKGGEEALVGMEWEKGELSPSISPSISQRISLSIYC